jgi:hypothetical protein
MPQVFAVAVSANAAAVGSVVGLSGAKRIEAAMADAVNYCYSQGIIEPDAVRAKMMEAREVVKQHIIAEQQVTPEGN